MDSPGTRSSLSTRDPDVLETLPQQSSSSLDASLHGARDVISSPTDNDAQPHHVESPTEPNQCTEDKGSEVAVEREVAADEPTAGDGVETIHSRLTFLPRHWSKLRQYWSGRIESSWAWEMCGMFLSVSFLVAIIATLPYLDKHPLSEWQFRLAPNTMISTFITVVKTSMLLVVAEGIGQLKWTYFTADAHRIAELQRFDVASRGPWGSLMLLLHADKKRALASVGAIITIAALAMDPFGQQIIDFETRQVPRNDTGSTIPVASAYDLQMRARDTLGALEWPLRGALTAGFFNSSSPLPISCPTGNCTWPELSTLGLCTFCTNVTQQVTASNCTFNYCDETGSCRGPGVKSCAFPPANQQSQSPDCLRWPKTDPIHFRIVNNFSIPDGVSFGASMYGHIMPTTQTRARWNVDVHEGGSIATSAFNLDNSGSTDKDVSNYAFIAATYEALDVDKLLEIGVCPRVRFKSILDCRFRMCLQTFPPARMVNGSMLKTTKRDTFLDWDSNVTAESDGQRSIYTQPPSASNNGSNEPLIPPNTFQVGGWWGLSLAKMLESLFKVNNAKIHEPNRLMVLDAVREAKDIPRVMADITDSVTNLIRLGPNRTDIHGTADYPEVFVVVRWQWCILPGALVVFSAVFFSLIVWDNRARNDSRAPLWKSNVLPFLFFGLEGWTREEMRVSENSTAMEEAARGMEAKMGRNEDGDRRLVREDASQSDASADDVESHTSAEGTPLSASTSQSRN